jgi:hypothetical protein
MNRIRWTIGLLGGLLATIAIVCQGQPHPDESAKSLPSGIAWYGVLTDGITDAKATNRPIMLLAAAPQCAGVPGMW